MKKCTIKKYVLFVLLVVTSNPIIKAQEKPDIFRKETPLTWLGVDFTQSRFFGDQSVVSATGMVDFYSRINYLIVSEPDKYNLYKTFSKENVIPNIEMVEKMNRTIDETKILSYNFADLSHLDAEKIQNMVSAYNTGNVKGLAVIFIMEGMNKPMELAAMWVTFFNAETKQVLLSARLTGKSGGIGFRNYWAATIYEVMKKIRSTEFKNWQKV